MQDHADAWFQQVARRFRGLVEAMKRQVGDLGDNLGFVADLTDDAARQRLHGFHYPIGGNRFFTLFACQYVDSHPALSKMTVGLYSQCMGGNKSSLISNC